MPRLWISLMRFLNSAIRFSGFQDRLSTYQSMRSSFEGHIPSYSCCCLKQQSDKRFMVFQFIDKVVRQDWKELDVGHTQVFEVVQFFDKAAFVDPAKLGPQDLTYGKIHNFKTREDAVIYEAHVRDFTSDPAIAKDLTKPFGTFEAFIENQTISKTWV